MEGMSLDTLNIQEMTHAQTGSEEETHAEGQLSVSDTERLEGLRTPPQEWLVTNVPTLLDMSAGKRSLVIFLSTLNSPNL